MPWPRPPRPPRPATAIAGSTTAAATPASPRPPPPVAAAVPLASARAVYAVAWSCDARGYVGRDRDEVVDAGNALTRRRLAAASGAMRALARMAAHSAGGTAGPGTGTVTRRPVVCARPYTHTGSVTHAAGMLLTSAAAGGATLPPPHRRCCINDGTAMPCRAHPHARAWGDNAGAAHRGLHTHAARRLLFGSPRTVVCSESSVEKIGAIDDRTAAANTARTTQLCPCPSPSLPSQLRRHGFVPLWLRRGHGEVGGATGVAGHRHRRSSRVHSGACDR